MNEKIFVEYDIKFINNDMAPPKFRQDLEEGKIVK